jgi:hypothetical protein
MAKLVESMVVIKVSELVKDDAEEINPMDNEVLEQLEAVVQELVGEGKLVELIKE